MSDGQPYTYFIGIPLPPITADGLEPTRGKYGDNLVCNYYCGWTLAIRLVAADRGILDALLAQAWTPSALANEAAIVRKEKSRKRRQARREARQLMHDTGKTPKKDKQ